MSEPVWNKQLQEVVVQRSLDDLSVAIVFVFLVVIWGLLQLTAARQQSEASLPLDAWTMVFANLKDRTVVLVVVALIGLSLLYWAPLVIFLLLQTAK